MKWITLCSHDELVEGQGKNVEIDGFALAVFLDDGLVRVIDDTCPHAGASLSGGIIDAGCAVCPFHGWAFNLTNGEMRDSPGFAVRTYPTRILDHQGRQLVQAELPIY